MSARLGISLALWAMGCSQPTIPTLEATVMYGGGDGGEVSRERVLSGTLTEDITLDASLPWILDGAVFVGEDGGAPVTLTIEPGAVIYGNPTSRGMLVVARGSRLVADGTATAPIVFTSPRARGARQAGDWGGVVINGLAPVNGCDAPPCSLEGEAATGLYGGSDPDDDSGVLRYVRIEFAGALYTTEDELNGLALQGVGRGTTVEHVQLHVTADDGIEFFGGTAQVSHVVITGAGDDAFDWTNGWTGKAQFVVIQQHPGAGDKGFEADNNEEDYEATPRSLPTIANATILGRSEGVTGLLLRRGTGVALSNSIVSAFDVCVDIADEPTWANVVLQGTWFDCPSAESVEALLVANPGNVFDDPALVSPSDVDAPDFRLLPVSGALSSAILLSDPDLVEVSYSGAFDASEDWTAGWISTGLN